MEKEFGQKYTVLKTTIDVKYFSSLDNNQFNDFQIAYKEAIDRRQTSFIFDDYKVSSNFAYYIINYYDCGKNNEHISIKKNSSRK